MIETLISFSCQSVDQVAGSEPVSPGFLDTVSDERAVMVVQEKGMGPVRPVSPEISSRAICSRGHHSMGREPVRPTSSTMTREVRAVMVDQDGGRKLVRPGSDVLLKEARRVRVDQEEGRGPVRGLNEILSVDREVKVDQSGGRELVMLLLLMSRDCRAVNAE